MKIFKEENKIEEIRSIIPVNVYWNGKGSFDLSFPGGHKVFNGSPESFAKFLMKLQAKDSSSQPRSLRAMTYSSMVNEIMEGKNTLIYVWSNYMNNLKGLVFNESSLKEGIYEDLQNILDSLKSKGKITSDVFSKAIENYETSKKKKVSQGDYLMFYDRYVESALNNKDNKKSFLKENINIGSTVKHHNSNDDFTILGKVIDIINNTNDSNRKVRVQWNYGAISDENVTNLDIIYESIKEDYKVKVAGD